MGLLQTINSLLSPAQRWEISGDSITGPVREHNEDCVSFSNTGNSGIAILADGVGGHNAGEVASKFVCEELKAWFENHQPAASLEEEKQALSEAIGAVHTSLYNMSLKKAKREGMATTLAMVMQAGRHAIYAWAGDSRVYLARQGRIRQLSEDHSFVEEKYREGIFTREDVEQHPMGNIITSCLGANATMTYLGLESVSMKRGDMLLLVSDGVSDVLNEEQLLYLLPSGEDGILEAAQEAFSNDNCSAVVVNVS